jgi:hypothetical protein
MGAGFTPKSPREGGRSTQQELAAPVCFEGQGTSDGAGLAQHCRLERSPRGSRAGSSSRRARPYRGPRGRARCTADRQGKVRYIGVVRYGRSHEHAPAHSRGPARRLLLSSNQVGEVAGAAAALNRVIAASGHDAHWLANLVENALQELSSETNDGTPTLNQRSRSFASSPAVARGWSQPRGARHIATLAWRKSPRGRDAPAQADDGVASVMPRKHDPARWG